MPENDPLSGLLGALIGGHPAVQAHMQNTGQSLDQVLAGLSNTANPPADGGATRSPLGDILGSMVSGSPQAGSAPATGDDPMSALLGSLLGGGMPQGGAPSQSAPATGGDPLSALLGGGMPQGGAPSQGAPAMGGDPMSALLGGLLGGGMQGGPGASALGSNAFLAPIVDAIAAKIGIPPPIAQVVVSFALTQLMGGQRDPQLAQMLGGRGNVSQKYLRDSGLVKQLAQQTGMDNKTATQSLQQVLQAFGTQMGTGTTEDRQQGLQSWLTDK
jgi:hypothetical protein